jgi:hypothetical protein
MVVLSNLRSLAVAVAAGVMVAMPSAFCNAPPHFYVLPGTCVTAQGASATTTYVTVAGKPGLSLFSNATNGPFSSSAEFVYESVDQNNNPTNFEIPQGTFSFDLTNNAGNGVLDNILVVGYYDNGVSPLLASSPFTASGHYTINTTPVRNLGALRHIGFIYTAEGGTVVVSNFQNNGRPTGVTGLNHNIGCLALPLVGN